MTTTTIFFGLVFLKMRQKIQHIYATILTKCCNGWSMSDHQTSAVDTVDSVSVILPPYCPNYRTLSPCHGLNPPGNPGFQRSNTTGSGELCRSYLHRREAQLPRREMQSLPPQDIALVRRGRKQMTGILHSLLNSTGLLSQ